jgi:hypothetical protein
MEISPQLQTWLLDSDPALRWQVLRDLCEGRDEEARFARSRIPDEGWGAQLLALQDAEGLWAGVPEYGPGWRSTTDALMLLRDFGVDPAAPAVRKAVDRVRTFVTWGEEFEHSPYFQGEVEPCINGRVLALGACFGLPCDGLFQRLIGEQLEDGGWNCSAPHSRRSSFHTTICVLEGLLEYENTVEISSDLRDVRRRGEEYLLARGLFRSLRTGEVINEEWLRLAFPNDWHYDILWGLDYFRRAGGPPDPRMAEAIALVRSKQNAAGQWIREQEHSQDVAFVMETGFRRPSRWITLRALRVLRWAGGRASSASAESPAGPPP